MISFSIDQLTDNESKLHAEARERARDYLRAEARLLEIIMDVDRTRLFAKLGFNSCFQYCVRSLSLSEAVAMNFINVARKANEVPELLALIQTEGVSISKARKIVPVLTCENKDEWLTKVTELTQARLEREVAEVMPETAQVERAKPVKNQKVRLEIYVSAEDFEIIRHAQDLVSRSKGTPADLAATFVAIAESFLQKKDPVAKAERRLSRNRSVRRTALPAAVRHAVHRRDGGRCQATRANGERCQSRRFVHLHHVREKSKGGSDSVDNLVTVCASCHRTWHSTNDQAALDGS